MAGGIARVATVANSLITHNAAGVHVASGATGTQIQNNDIVDNNKMSVLTQTPTNDDSGAFGVLLNGDNSNVGNNGSGGAGNVSQQSVSGPAPENQGQP